MPRRRGRGGGPSGRPSYSTSSGGGDSYVPPEWAPPDDLGGGGTGSGGGSGNITITNINTAIANAGSASEGGPGDLYTGPIGPSQPGPMMGGMSMAMDKPTMGMMGNSTSGVSYKF